MMHYPAANHNKKKNHNTRAASPTTKQTSERPLLQQVYSLVTTTTRVHAAKPRLPARTRPKIKKHTTIILLIKITPGPSHEGTSTPPQQILPIFSPLTTHPNQVAESLTSIGQPQPIPPTKPKKKEGLRPAENERPSL